jgi:enterochelin esterase-like enzyme
MDQGEGQHWFRKPGNLYSEPVRVHLDAVSTTPIRITLTRAMPAAPSPADSKYIRHVRMESKLLTAFWGRPMHLGAVVIVPEGFDEHPDAHYPVLYYQGHFASTFTQLRAGTPFYRAWTGGKLPRMLIVLTQDANPFYDDSYAVNSANLGPYGDALIEELYPYVERKFRGIGQGWSRAVYGGSTGGWRALALQIFHPDFFNLAWAVSPDPIDFRAFQLVNLYDDPNAFFAASEWKQAPIPMLRDREGRIVATMEDALRFETVLGTKSRSGEQFDIWQAVFSPPGADGYPAEIFDRRTGAIDSKVAAYWKEHYDLVEYLRKNWKNVGPRLAGKLHITAGVADAFYLERSVKLAKEFLEGTAKEGEGPYYAGSVEFDPNSGHGMGVPGKAPEKTFHERLMEALSERIRKTALPGADLSWR